MVAQEKHDHTVEGNKTPHIGPTTAVVGAAASAGIVIAFPWARPWLYSGCAILSLLIAYGSATRAAALRSTPPWATLAALNLVYLITCTSWLQYRCFTTICWLCITTTIFLLSPTASSVTRRGLRKLLAEAYFIPDGIAAFNLPGLHFDTRLEGLLVVRGWTYSLSTLTIEVHGLELAHNLGENMHLAAYCESVVIRICRGIELGEIYGVVKQKRYEIDPGQLSQAEKEDASNLGTQKQPSESTIRAFGDGESYRPKNIATDSEASIHEGPRLNASMTSADSVAKGRYDDVRRQIRITSPMHQALEEVGGTPSCRDSPLAHQKTRAAMCYRLETLTSVSHYPSRTIKISTILDFIPVWLRRVLARMPFLLRLILMPLSYLHPITTASIAVSASGSWLAAVMQDSIYSRYADDRDDIKQLEQTICDWLTNATFCLDLANVRVVAKVLVRASEDIESFLSCASSAVMRVEHETNEVAPALRIEGVDATLIIPSYLLPCHEHLIPQRLSEESDWTQDDMVESSERFNATGDPASEADTATIKLSTHLSFPAILDSTMVDFFADLIGATIVMTIEGVDADDDRSSSTNESTIGRAQTRITDGAHHVRKSIKKGMKKAAFSTTDDGRIPQIVRKIAEHLESLHGNVGYAGNIPIDLGPFRGSRPVLSKWLA